jgi:two-component system, NtrC family, response regulator AtoC
MTPFTDSEELEECRPYELAIFAGQDVIRRTLDAGSSLTIGRGDGCGLRIDHPSVSRVHAHLRHVGERLALEDLGSANGTFLRDFAAGGDSTGRLIESRLEPHQPVLLDVGSTFHVGSVVMVLHRVKERSAFGDTGAAEDDEVVVRSPAMRRIHQLVAKAAPSTLSILVLGETGVGKEVFAETIHRRSPRASGPLVRVNCAALSESILESELFGHEKGAYTGAVSKKHGLVLAADRGTLFLDEVGELPMSVQPKLLRVLEDKKVVPVGGVEEKSVDVRIVAATNRDLERAIAERRFREDLYFRLAGLTVTIPPLRERSAEILPLARLFLRRVAESLGRGQVPALSPSAEEALAHHAWPGNVRELKNLIERSLVLHEGAEILAEDLAFDERRSPSALGEDIWSDLEALERRRIVDALESCGGNQTQAASRLGMSRRTLVNRLAHYKLPRPRLPVAR